MIFLETYQVSTVRVKLTSGIVRSETNTSLVETTSYLDIGAGPHELLTTLRISDVAGVLNC